jgi:hypothetical protein
MMGFPGAAALPRCHVSNVSYTYPHQANPNQLITVYTTVTGSCVSTGDDYYALRVDLVDAQSNSLARVPVTIGYNASNFTVTAEDSAVTPSINGTWPLQANVYVIRAGGTSGSTLLDYQTTENITILVGTTPVPEFSFGLGFTVFASLTLGIALFSISGARRRTWRSQSQRPQSAG